MAVFSLAALVIGLAAAMKLSTVLALRISDQSYTWLPFLSFMIILIVVAMLVNMAGRVLSGAMNIAMLGWVNKLGGVVFYLILYAVVISMVLFYLSQMGWISASMTQKSVLYEKFSPLGPYVIEKLSTLMPVFKNMFEELKDFFGEWEHKI